MAFLSEIFELVFIGVLILVLRWRGRIACEDLGLNPMDEMPKRGRSLLRALFAKSRPEPIKRDVEISCSIDHR
jgi:hypothetical protein